MPLLEVPTADQRNKLKALHEATINWADALKKDQSLNEYIKKDEFIASHPGVPSRTNEEDYISLDDLEKFDNPVSKKRRWRGPSIAGEFITRNKKVFVNPFEVHINPLMYLSDPGFPGNYDDDAILVNYISTEKEFQDEFPWWVLASVAGGKKIYDKDTIDHPEEIKSPILKWEQAITKAVKNIEFCISTLENLPCPGPTLNSAWIWKDLDELISVHRWLKQLMTISCDTIVVADYDMKAAMQMTFDNARKNKFPEETLNKIQKMASDSEKYYERFISANDVNATYYQSENLEKGRKWYSSIHNKELFNSLDYTCRCLKEQMIKVDK